MSLVAYDSSDGSDSNEDEELQETVNKPGVETSKPEPKLGAGPAQSKSALPTTSRQSAEKPDHDSKHLTVNPAEQTTKPASQSAVLEPHYSDDDEDDFMLGQSSENTSFGLHLPAPRSSSFSQDTVTGSVDSDSSATSASLTLFSKLPTVATPRNADATSTATDSSVLGLPPPKTAGVTGAIEDDKLEDMVKPKPAELELAAQQKPPGKKAARQRVKITIPDLPDADSDEESEPQSKKPRQTGGKSGLFSLLPAPIHAVVKETNRKLIPHTLTRKPAPSAKKPAPKKVQTHAGKSTISISRGTGLSAIQDEDSDDEGEDGGQTSNFFSLGDGDSKPTLPAATALPTLLPSVVRAPSAQTATPVASDPGVASSSGQQSAAAVAEPSSPLPPVGGPNEELANAPLQFKSSFSPTTPPVGPWGTQQWGHSQQDGSAYGQHQQEFYTNQQYNYANIEEKDYPEAAPDDAEQGSSDVDMEQLLRLQGKRLSRREEINLIDVSADDQVNQMDLTKTLTEESDMMSHSKKKNKDMPSGQQKRKHQITYLAFKAKEREIALKNQWADSRISRKQSQAKYGF